MEYYYVSQWKSSDAHTFELCGVIGVGRQEIAAYFPNDAEEGVEFAELQRKWKDVGNEHAPLAWLRQIAMSGNGITEEYDEVRVIAAPSLEQALRDAYEQALQEYGAQIVLYQHIGDAGLEDLGDPFTELFPENAPPPPVGGLPRRSEGVGAKDPPRTSRDRK